MTIAIFGAEGQLGCDLQAVFSGHTIESISHDRTDITNADAVSAVLGEIRPAWVINAAAMTNVDLCESEEDTAFAVNADGAGNVAAVCAGLAARLIHISTDYVFDGGQTSPYRESDATHPLSVYGRSKLEGERRVAATTNDYYTVRSSGLYGTHECRGKGGRNFVETMLDLASRKTALTVVDDEVLTPTFTEDLAERIARIVQTSPPPGIYHATNDGQCSWFEFAGEIFRAAGVTIDLQKTTAAKWNAPAKRPAYSVLDNSALRDAGINSMPH
jgi:dTDP-4-dehydrorhamnose reductase